MAEEDKPQGTEGDPAEPQPDGDSSESAPDNTPPALPSQESDPDSGEPSIRIYYPDEQNEGNGEEADKDSEPPEPEAAEPDQQPSASGTSIGEPEPTEPSADDDAAEADESMSADDLDPENFKSAVEAVLFCCDRPMTARKLANIIGVGDGRKIRSAIKLLQKEYESTGRAFQIEEVAGGYQMFTLPEYHPWVKRLGKQTKEERLSQAALETLAIVAYRQPILRADIEAIRGVQCGPMLRALIERGLVKIAGKSEELGRPLLYGTTRKFLEAFGLRSLSELPQSQELLAPAASATDEDEEDDEEEDVSTEAESETANAEGEEAQQEQE